MSGTRNPTRYGTDMSDTGKKSANTGDVPLLDLKGITKQYPGTLANDAVDLRIEPGQVHALLGENGAGKSTLVKIIYGVVKPDAGDMLWEGEKVNVANPAHARRLGVGMVFQHFNLFDTLTVAENISLGVDGRTDLSALEKEVSEVSERYGLPVDPRRHVHSLSVGERQRIEIVRCLLQDPKLLIMDEPTSVLTPQEVDKLFETLRRLQAEGRSILYISHKLDEIMALCDAATVLRGGKVSATCDPRKENAKSLAEMMIGSELPHFEPREGSVRGEIVLEVTGLSHETADPFGTNLKDIDLTVHAGEMVGIAGVAGNGQKEFLASLSGEIISDGPNVVKINGAPVGTMTPGGRRQRGLAFVPEERLGRGAVPEMPLADNTLLTAGRMGLVQHGMIRFDKAEAYADRIRAEFDVRSAGSHAEAKSLSGGNLQKFIIGREMLLGPKLLILAHPTWGVDVGAATAIHQAILDLKEGGTAVLMVSEDLDEIFELCDRIAVIGDGKMSPAVRNRDTSVEEIGVWMSGNFESADARAAEARGQDAKGVGA